MLQSYLKNQDHIYNPRTRSLAFGSKQNAALTPALKLLFRRLALKLLFRRLALKLLFRLLRQYFVTILTMSVL